MTRHLAQSRRRIGACLLIGQKPGGCWVVRDESNLCGGLFTNRQDAIRFALAEGEKRRQPVLMLPNGVDLELSDIRRAA
jgi:hypothetical protein